MTQPHTPIRLLIMHREADEAVLVLARGLAQLPDFEVYLTREGISSPTEEEGVTLCPMWCTKSHVALAPDHRERYPWEP